MTGGDRGGNPRLFDLESAAMSAAAPKGLDADLWIQERQRHGQHVVVRGIQSDYLVHPGCAEGECEYSGLDIKPTTVEKPMYVAEISKDGAVTSELRATWEDVVTHELEQKKTAGA